MGLSGADERSGALDFGANGARRSAAAAAAAQGGRRERGRGRRQNGVEGLGTRGGVPTRGRGWSAAARPTPAYGRHVAVTGWGEAGAARGREGRGRQAGLLAGPKGRRVGPAAPVPFSFFLKLFSQILSKFIWTI